MGKKAKRILKRAGFLASVLAPYYIIVDALKPELPELPVEPLPAEIRAIDTDLPSDDALVFSTEGRNGERRLEHIVHTTDIDWEEDFYLETDHYRIIKEDDFFLTRFIGHGLSIFTKLYFWDWDCGLGLDEEQTRNVVALLENDETLEGLTVRINNNGVLHDTLRLVTDPEVRERNNILSRLTVGVLMTTFGELFAELRRGDYYNPMTQTAILYSNIDAIFAHEFGHHRDFQRFDSDWEYVLSRMLPPVMLYQEARASLNAKELLGDYREWQFYRYLVPAFFSYLVLGWGRSKSKLQKEYLKATGDTKKWSAIDVDERPEIAPLQTLRHFFTTNVDLYSGIAAYTTLNDAGAPGILSSLAFCAAAVGADTVLNALCSHVLPYEHEKYGEKHGIAPALLNVIRREK